MRILITGSGGLIGRFLTQAFLAQGHAVAAVYRTTPPKLEGPSSRLRLIQVDLSKGLEELAPAEGLEPADVIVHAAAHTHLIPHSTAGDYVHANLLGTLNLIDYANAVTPRCFVYLSAMSVYGDVTVGELDEDTPLNRPELYGASKYVAELIVREAGGAFPVLCVRLPGVVGRGYFTPWIGTMLRAAMRHEPLRIYNSEAPFNNLVDLQEIARFLAHVIERGTAGCDLVNLAASEPMRIRDVVGLLRSLTRSRSEVLVMDRAQKRSFVISTARLRDRLGFQASTTQDMIRRYVAEHVSEGSGLRDGPAPVAEPLPNGPLAVVGPGGGR